MIGNMKKFTLGAFYAATGLLFALFAWRAYPLQDGAAIGPGYFPFYLGILLAAIGGGLAIGSLRVFGQQPWALAVGWSALVPVFGSIAVFALLLEGAGLFLSVWAMAVVASLASRPRSAVRSLAVGLAIAALCQAIFVWGLGIHIQAAW